MAYRSETIINGMEPPAHRTGSRAWPMALFGSRLVSPLSERQQALVANLSAMR